MHGRSDSTAAFRRSLCSVPKRGQGGCAFRGAKLALQPIADALHLVHGTIVCQGHSWQSRPTASSGPTLHRISFSSALSDLDVTLGAEARLSRCLDELTAKYNPPAIFVYATCVPSMSGDDIRAVCKAASLRLRRPVLAVDAPGFLGDKQDGVDIAAKVLLEDVIGTSEPEVTTATDIVLIGENNVAAEAVEIKALLARCGIRVLASIPGDGRFAEIAGAHRGRAAILHCSQSLAYLGPALQVRYGIPYVGVSFYGAAHTSAALRSIAALLITRGAPVALASQVDAVIDANEAAVAAQLQALLPRLRGKRVLLLTGGVKSWSLADTVQRFGMQLAGVSSQKCSEVDRQQLDAVIAGACPIFDGMDADELDERLASGDVDLVLGGSFSRFAVQRRCIPWLEVNHERRIALTGYVGTVALARAMTEVLECPVLEFLRAERGLSE
jgi:nitrogenase molybdenum-cofactor synthesis protein NifE